MTIEILMVFNILPLSSFLYLHSIVSYKILSSTFLLCYTATVMSYETGTYIDLRHLNKTAPAKAKKPATARANLMAVAVQGYEGMRYQFKAARRIPVVYVA